MDQKTVLSDAIRLIQAMVDVISSSGWLKPALAAMEVSQMVVQSLWDSTPNLMQLPHFTKELCEKCAEKDIETVSTLLPPVHFSHCMYALRPPPFLAFLELDMQTAIKYAVTGTGCCLVCQNWLRPEV